MSTRKSSRGSASGGGSSASSRATGAARSTSTVSADAGAAPSTTPPAGRRDDERRGALGAEGLARARGRARAEQPHGPRRRGAQPARVQGAEEAVAAPVREQAAQDRGGRVRDGAERRAVVAPRLVEHGELRRLAAVQVDHRHAVVRAHGDHRGAARAHPVGLPRGVDRQQARACAATADDGDGHGGQAVAGWPACSLSACSISCWASARLPSASSFLSSFSTTRRL